MLKMTTWGETFKRIEEYNIVNTGRHKNVIELLREECKKYNIECYPIEMYSLNSYKFHHTILVFVSRLVVRHDYHRVLLLPCLGGL